MSARSVWPVVRWQLHRGADVTATIVVVAVAEVGLRASGLRRTAQVLGVKLGGESQTMGDAAGSELPLWAHRRLRTVDRVMRRWPFGDTCLRRALVGAQRLRRLDPQVVVGVRLVDDAFGAHAWIRVDGCDLDVEARSYHVIDADPRR